MKIIACQQRSDAWRALRVGKLTGSRIAGMFATRKDGSEAAGRRNLRIDLVLERLTGQPHDSGGFHSFDMDRGANLEEAACNAYEADAGIFVEPVGFVAHDELLTGCSPDGVVFSHDGQPVGVIEIKCPKAATHLDYLRGGLPSDYRWQILHALWLTGAEWGDFVSFHPAFPAGGRLKRTRISASEVDFTAHELNVRAFLTEVEKEVEAVRELFATETLA